MPFQLVVITPPTTAPGELATAAALLDRGLQALHVRKPGAGPDEVRAYLQALPAAHRRRCTLHAHHELARQVSLRGIHYREADRPPGIIKAPPGLAVSTSFHALADLGVCRGEVDYALLSPIYPSISKPGYGASSRQGAASSSSSSADPSIGGGAGGSPTFDPDTLAGALATARCPVLALGGVTPDKFEELAERGFAGAALLGAVWQAGDPVAAWDAARREAERL